MVNALRGECIAEADVLPATVGFHRYRLNLAEDLELYLIDSPGLDGSDQTDRKLLEQAAQSDLLIWISQANQPAKSLDRNLIEKWDAYFDRELGRKKPPILLVTTHNDMLPAASDWNPPYNFDELDNPRVKLMLEALVYTSQAMGLKQDTLGIAVAMPEENAFNIDTLKDVLVGVSSEARASQLNRERLNAANSTPVVMRGLRQAGSALKSALDLAIR